jgi:hypothetical protein
MSLRLAAASLLVGALLIGMAQVALLPPWEGIDETAHYSYIQQLAEIGTWPRFGDPVSAEVEDYLKIAPSAYAKWSYKDFFDAPAEIIESGRAAARAVRDPSRLWRPGHGDNWQAQHPPIYYLLMVPAYQLSKGWSLADQLFLIRGSSYLLAWLGLCLATFSSFHEIDASPTLGTTTFLAPALWPLLFPMWFPEMARLGNDSLIVLLVASAFIILRRVLVSNVGLNQYILLGIICGLGLLTKATFLPLVIVIVAVLLLQRWQRRLDLPVAQSRSHGLIAYIITIGVVSGWWYTSKFLETGDLLASSEVITLQQQYGGLIHGLTQNEVFRRPVRGIVVVVATFLWNQVATFLWGGTWSFMMLPSITYVPMILMLLLLCYGYVWSMTTAKFTFVRWVPPLALLGLLAGLIHHALIYLAKGGRPVIPGWYFHSFAPVLSVMIAGGLTGLIRTRALRYLILMLMFYPLLFLPLAIVVEAQLFSGCAARKFGYVLYYDMFPISCRADLAKIWNHLSVFAFPIHAACLFTMGWLLMLFGVSIMAHHLRGGRPALPRLEDKWVSPRHWIMAMSPMKRR